MKILIIKLSAIGDVLRTTTLLHGLKRKFPDAAISWLTYCSAADLLRGNHLIDRLFGFNAKNSKSLKKGRFDLLICLDKEREATSLARDIAASRKAGFGIDKNGKLAIFNKESEYAYRLGISDELKFRSNRKSYPEIIYEMCGLEYMQDRYILNLSKPEIMQARHKLARSGINKEDFVIGLNTGAGARFANKMWPFEKHKALIKEMLKIKDIRILLLGGRMEKGLNQALKAVFKDKIYDSGNANSLREFASIIKHCNVIITGDTLAMHIAIALNKYVVAIFGPTCSQEIELYDNGIKIVSDLMCSPCYKRRCNKKDNCMSRIKIKDVIEKLECNHDETLKG
jgi:heptosyltransferase-2